MSTTPTAIDPARVEAFVGLAVQEAGAALNSALVTIGDRLGLYRTMACGEPVSAAALAGQALAGMFQATMAAIGSCESVTERFRTGRGLGRHEHHHDLFHDPSGSSAVRTGPTSSRGGCPPSRASSGGWRPRSGSPTSAAATAPRRC